MTKHKQTTDQLWNVLRPHLFVIINENTGFVFPDAEIRDQLSYKLSRLGVNKFRNIIEKQLKKEYSND